MPITITVDDDLREHLMFEAIGSELGSAVRRVYSLITEANDQLHTADLSGMAPVVDLDERRHCSECGHRLPTHYADCSEVAHIVNRHVPDVAVRDILPPDYDHRAERARAANARPWLESHGVDA